MEIDEQQLREFLLWMLDLLYQARRELISYQVAHKLLDAAGIGQEFDQLLKQAGENPSPALLVDHQRARDTIVKFLSEEKFDAALEFLRNWKPEGSIH